MVEDLGEKQKKILRLCDLEKLNIFDFLRPYKDDIKEVFLREGTAATRRIIKNRFKINMRGREIREFLDLNDPENDDSRKTHSYAWKVAGWRGEYSPLGYSNKMTELIAAELVNKKSS